MTKEETIFQDIKAYWGELAKNQGAIYCPTTQFEDRKLCAANAEDILLGFPEDRLESATVLDFGCGEGRMIPYIAPYVKEYIGVDASPSCVERAEKFSRKFTNVKILELLNPFEIPFELRQVNLIFSWTVFQHTPDLLLKAMLKALAAGLQVGAFAHLQFDWPPIGWPRPREERYRWDVMKDDDFHCRWWPEEVLSRIIEDSGLTIYERPTPQFQCWRMRK